MHSSINKRAVSYLATIHHHIKLHMKITIESCRIVKPTYNGNAPNTNDPVTLSVFDKVTYNMHITSVYAFNPPTPSNIAIEKGLSKVLAEYREWAGRLGEDAQGNLVIFLNDHGVRFVEATVDSELRNELPSKPTKELENLHPSVEDVDELLLVQLTRFKCGSLVIGFTSHHIVSDGHAASNFLIAWGLATRGLPIDPIPLRARDTLFKPRDKPLIQYDHQNIEYMNYKSKKAQSISGNKSNEKEIETLKVHFTNEFINKLRTKVSAMVSKRYSKFETILAHLWRVITKARNFHGNETTKLRISVDGRMRLNPKVPNEYFGNLVLWAFPCSTAKDLIRRPLSYTVELIHAHIKKVNDSYFKSFIDFASSDIIRKEGLVSTAVVGKRTVSPILEVDSWLTFPFLEVDFGSGRPFYFMPTHFDAEGMLTLLPSYSGDGSIDVIVSLFSDEVDTFKMYCYSVEDSSDASFLSPYCSIYV